LYDIARPEVFIKNILRGSILGKAKKIITSRPRQLLELPKTVRPKYILSILGLGTKAQQQICEDICGENSDKVFDYIQQQPSIATYCYVPCNCILVMHAINNIEEIQSKQEQPKPAMPNTITGIFSIVLCLFVASPHIRGSRSDFLLQKLAYLAWEGFKNRKFSFTETDLENAQLTTKELNLFFVTIFTKNTLTLIGGDATKISYFSHLLIQEFLAALHLLYFTSEKKFKKLVIGKTVGPFQWSTPTINLTQGNWEMVTKFLFGICNSATQARLKDTFSKLKSIVSHKITLLREFALENLPKTSTTDEDYFQRILPVCTWVYELNDDEFAASVASRLKKNIIINGKVLPSDISTFTYILHQRKAPINIDCGQFDTWFVGDSLKHLINATKEFKSRKPHITVFTVHFIFG